MPVRSLWNNRTLVGDERTADHHRQFYDNAVDLYRHVYNIHQPTQHPPASATYRDNGLRALDFTKNPTGHRIDHAKVPLKSGERIIDHVTAGKECSDENPNKSL
jgi:hypothetical protein